MVINRWLDGMGPPSLSMDGYALDAPAATPRNRLGHNPAEGQAPKRRIGVAWSPSPLPEHCLDPAQLLVQHLRVSA